MIAGPEPLFINNGFFKFMAFEDPDLDFKSFDIDLDPARSMRPWARN